MWVCLGVKGNERIKWGNEVHKNLLVVDLTDSRMDSWGVAHGSYHRSVISLGFLRESGSKFGRNSASLSPVSFPYFWTKNQVSRLQLLVFKLWLKHALLLQILFYPQKHICVQYFYAHFNQTNIRNLKVQCEHETFLCPHSS